VNGLTGWLALAAGGAAGTLARYALGGWIARRTDATFPWETCAINVLGCLAIGGVAAYADRGGFLSPTLRIALMVGVLGGFTTFSTFGIETFRLAAQAEWGRAAAYVAITNLAGLAAVWAGYRGGELL
jgi:CrcB protein